MSLSTQTEKRLPTIKAGLLKGLNYTTIGTRCGVTERTIDRDIKAFVDSGEFEIWIKTEWARLYSVIQKEEPVEAFRNLTKLLGRMVTHRIEKQVDIHERIEEYVQIDVTENEDEILSKAAAILARKDKSHKIH